MNQTNLCNQPLSVVILAAGQGTRMKTTCSKVLQPLAGIPMLQRVIESAETLNPNQVIIIHGNNGDELQKKLSRSSINWVYQAQQLGTAHAVQLALPHIDDDEMVLVLYADVPLIQPETLAELLQRSHQHVGLLTTHLNDPTGFGRIVRDQSNQVIAIIEHKDADASIRAINEINTGIICARNKEFKQWINQIDNDNQQKEYYLTDIIKLAVADQVSITSIEVRESMEVMGANTLWQLQQLERFYQCREAKKWCDAGVRIIDPSRLDIRCHTIEIGADSCLEANVVLEGDVCIGQGCTIGHGSILKNVKLADHVIIKPYSIVEDSQINTQSEIGPFARLRPGSNIGINAKVGNFVEIKQTRLGNYSKASHLSYLGNSDIAEQVNIGAGTITCNYDGINKHTTTIEKGAFIGANSALIAPITIKEEATIGAGSVISRSTPAKQLTLTRGKQQSIKNWTSPRHQLVDKNTTG